MQPTPYSNTTGSPSAKSPLTMITLTKRSGADRLNLVGYLLPAVAILTAGMLVALIVPGGTTLQALAPVE